MIEINKLDHIQICIPHGKEEEARRFYTNILGFEEIKKPDLLIKNGGLWYQLKAIQFHIGCEDENTISKRHPAFEVKNIQLVKQYLLNNNVRIKEDEKIPNCERFSFFDPFNNRIEFLEKSINVSSKIIEYWNDFISKNQLYQYYSIPKIDHFCNDEILTNRLAMLVKNGIKTATCSALIDYKISNEELPKINELSIITNWDKEPVCIIKTIKVELKKFKDINAIWAKKEGEGDLSLEYWQAGHQRFFSEYLDTIGVAFTENLELVCEEFVKIW